MVQLNTILAAINMSVFDKEVIKRALLIAKENGAQLHFIYAIDIPVIDIEISSESLKKNINKDSIKKGIVQEIDAIDESQNLEYFIHISVGDASAQIIHLAQKIHAELIILGSHSKVKIEDYYLGSTANYIAKNSVLPVLVIKNSVDGMYKSILAPVDLSNSSKNNVLFAKRAFKSVTIKLVYAYEDLDDLAIDYLELKPNKNDNKPVLIGRSHRSISKEDVKIDEIKMLKSSFSINESLLEYINKVNSDLIIISSGGSDIAGSYLGSTAAFLLRNVHSDILIEHSE